MAVTITDEQAKNSATSLRVSAASQLATTDLVDPPVSPTPVPPGGGGSTPAPSGFTGRTLGDLAVWKQQASFEENFPTLAPRGQFLSIYKMWGAYPEHYQSTDKKGFYDPDSRPKKLRRIFFHCEEVNDWLREQDEDVRTGRRTKRG